MTDSGLLPVASWFHLPDEVWGRIFELSNYDPALPVVCKWFHQVFYSCVKFTSASAFGKRLRELKPSLCERPRTDSDNFLSDSYDRVDEIIEALERVMFGYNRAFHSLLPEFYVAQRLFFVMVYRRAVRLVERMLQTDPRLDPNMEEAVALRYACSIGDVELASVLMKDYRVDPSVQDNVLLIVTAPLGHTEVIKLLLSDSRVNPASSDYLALRRACNSGQVEVLKILLEDHRVDPEAAGHSCIRLAATKGHLEVVQLLLRHPRVDPSEDDNVALVLAAQNGQAGVVRLLVDDSRVDPAVHDNLALKYALLAGHKSTVKVLLENPRVAAAATPDLIRKASYICPDLRFCCPLR